MEFRELQYLLTLAETRNMTRAAEQLYISQSALSHYLKCVEEELGVRLFDRSTNPMSLTQAGRCYIDSARKIVLENEKLKKELRDITQHMSGKLTLGSSRDRASYMMPRILPKFAERYPGIELEVFTASGQKLFEALREGRVDMVLLPAAGQEDMKGLSSELIYSEELVLAARKGVVPQADRIDGRNAIHSEALDNAPFFLLHQEHAMRSFCNRYFRHEKIHPDIRMEFSSNISCYRMAATGMGYAIIPYLTTRMTDPGDPVELFSLGREPQTWEVHIFTRKGAYLGKPEQELIQIAKYSFDHEILQG
jgi:DNA-binding transcriptional LysR family regulator